MKGLTTGWRFGGRLEWLGPTACRSATPTSGLGHGTSVEAVSYGAAPAAWPPPQPPYAPGASETVSVMTPSCSWTYSSSSTPTERPALGRMPGELNRIAGSDGPQEPARCLSSSPAPRHQTSGTRGITDVPAVGQRGGMQGPGLWWTEEGSECAVHVYLFP